MEEIESANPKHHIFICVNERKEGEKPSCGPRITAHDAKEIKFWLLQQGLRDIQVTKTLCLGYCNAEGSVMCMYPSGKFIKGIMDKEDIKKIIKEEILK